jgi:hypothetical protein
MPFSPRSRILRRCIAAAAAAGLAWAAGTLAAPTPVSAAPRTQPATVSLGAIGRQIPSSFLGLSIETSDLFRYEHQAGFTAFLSQLAAPGTGPLSLRIGGESADSSYLPGTAAPAGSVTLTPAWFAALHELASTVPLSIIFDLNLAGRSPSAAAGEARAALAALPLASVHAFEIGNEPDLYRGGVVGFRRVVDNPLGLGWAATYSPGDYAADFRRFAGALHPLIGSIPLAGPSIAWPDIRWWTDLPTRGSASPGLITQHRYPYSACLPATSPAYPSVKGFLSSVQAAQLVGSVRTAVTTAHHEGVPFRISEMGSASCGGLPRVTNTLAVALWAPDMMFRMLAAGVDGVDVHTRWDAWNTPLDGAPSLTARPLLYGLALFIRTLGPGARLQAVTFTGARPAKLSAWAVHLAGSAERLLLINRGSRAITIRARLGTTAPVTVLALSGSAPNSSSVTLGGRQLTSAGRFESPPHTDRLEPRQGAATVSVPAYSAVLLGASGRS